MPTDLADRITGPCSTPRRLPVGPAARARQLEGTGRRAGRWPGPRRRHGARDAIASRTTQPIYLAAAVAAAVAVVAVGASALHLTKRPNGAAAIGDTYGSGVSTSPSSGPRVPHRCPVQPTGHAAPLHPAQHDGILPRQARRAGEDAPRPPRSADRRPGSRVTGRRSHRHPHGPRVVPAGDRAATAPTRRPRPCRPISRPSTDTPRSWWS